MTDFYIFCSFDTDTPVVLTLNGKNHEIINSGHLELVLNHELNDSERYNIADYTIIFKEKGDFFVFSFFTMTCKNAQKCHFDIVSETKNLAPVGLLSFLQWYVNESYDDVNILFEKAIRKYKLMDESSIIGIK